MSKDLLRWYDVHARLLPWRARPGEPIDPYRVWLSEIMLQQTTVRAVAPYFQAFLARWPVVEALAAAPTDDVMRAWAGLGYYARARNLHACAKAVTRDHGGRFPANAAGLRTLPGIGDYTAAAIAAIAFGEAVPVVDGNVERVVSRLVCLEQPLPAAKPTIRAMLADRVPADRPGDFAQAMMDLGATICTPKSPACALCPLNAPCSARKSGTMANFPRKLPKPERRTRYGTAFVITNPEGAVLLRTRPPTGLLGGTVEVPNSDWTETEDHSAAMTAAPLRLDFRPLGRVRHVFTHFPLELRVMAAMTIAPAPSGHRFVAKQLAGQEALSNLMRKVLALLD